MKSLLKIVGIILLVILLLIIVPIAWFFFKLATTPPVPAAPEDYETTVETGGAIEEKIYLSWHL